MPRPINYCILCQVAIPVYSADQSHCYNCTAKIKANAMGKSGTTSKCEQCGVSQQAHNMRRIGYQRYLCPSCDPRSRRYKAFTPPPAPTMYTCSLCHKAYNAFQMHRNLVICQHCYNNINPWDPFSSKIFSGDLYMFDSILAQHTANINNTTAAKPREWAYVKVGTPEYPKGYYLIKRKEYMHDVDAYAVQVEIGHTPVDGEICYTASFRLYTMVICPSFDKAFTYQKPLPTKEEIERSGRRFIPTSAEQLIRFIDFDYDGEDNGIGPEHIMWDLPLYAQIKKDIVKLISSTVIYFSFSNPLGDNMPKVILIPDKAAGCHDLRFEFSGRARNQGDAIKGAAALLRATIPSSDRSYDGVTHTWSFLDKYIPAIKQLVITLGFELEEQLPLSQDGFFYEHAINSPEVVSKESLAEKLVTILAITHETLKDSIATKKAYRAAALRLHPDRNNGDGSKMSELNSIWSAYNAS